MARAKIGKRNPFCDSHCLLAGNCKGGIDI